MTSVGFVVFPGFQLMGFSAVTVFEVANLTVRDSRYTVTLISEEGGLVEASAGFAVCTEPFDERVFDLLIVGAGTSIIRPSSGLLSYLQYAAKRCRRLAAPCTGAFLLAEAGLLSQRRATTHWFFARELKRRFPEILVEEDRIFVNDGNLWTSAGMSATIDLALTLVEDDLGGDIAKAVARKLVVFHRRAGGQSQFSTLLDLEPKSDRIQRALHFAASNLSSITSVDAMAEAAQLSTRQFSRAFRSETGQSPGQALEKLRVESARLMIETGRHALDDVARVTGFGDRERMRRAFIRSLGHPPQTLRRNARLQR